MREYATHIMYGIYIDVSNEKHAANVTRANAIAFREKVIRMLDHGAGGCGCIHQMVFDSECGITVFTPHSLYMFKGNSHVNNTMMKTDALNTQYIPFNDITNIEGFNYADAMIRLRCQDKILSECVTIATTNGYPTSNIGWWCVEYETLADSAHKFVQMLPILHEVPRVDVSIIAPRQVAISDKL